MILLVLLLLGATVKGQHLPCGSTPITQSRVIGGQNAQPGAWPWQIALKRYGRFICGGSLISKNWVVTAAHCVAGSSNPANYKIVVGDHNRNTNEGTEQEVGARRIISHPSYNSPRLNNDIALIQLSISVNLSQRVNPVCLPNHDSDIPTGSKCYITGWGKIRHPGSSYHILQQAMMPPINNSRCKQKIQSSGVSISFTRQMLCAGVENTILSGCHGDSGGPYVCLNSDNRTYTLHGAVSWGSGSCNARLIFTVFARVTQFRAWIRQHTGLGGGGGGGSPPPPPSPPIPTTPGGNLATACNFDSSMCGFTQDKSDKFDWTRNKGGTSSSSTGPSSDHTSGNGYYMYIETSSPRVRGDYAILISPMQRFSGIMCLKFSYHMHGATIGRLNVTINSKTVFYRRGNQGNRWFDASITIYISGLYPVKFRGERGSSYTGDIAIDDFSLQSGSCSSITTSRPPTPSPPVTTPRPPTPSPSGGSPPPPPSPPIPTTPGGNLVFSCNFDKIMNLCGFTQLKNDKFDWTQKYGSTSSAGTGPSSDASGSGRYMYIETSYPRVRGDNAKLEKSGLSFQTKKCLSFYYHMYGSSMGTLNVYVGSKKVFTKSGNQGNKWNKASVDITEPGASTLVFEGIRGSSYTGDAAIDNVELKDCAFSCNFDSGMCNFVQEAGDQFDWTRRRGSTPSTSTGPSGDHTSGNGYYIYTEASSPRKRGDIARISSPSLEFRGKMCLSFAYHMFGWGIGTLNVIINGKKYFTLSGYQDNKWFEKKVTISGISGKHEVTFEGIVGKNYQSDISIDDFSLTPGGCTGGSCGVSPQTRIVGGTAARHGDWPWQAQLRTTSGFPYCGGSLVHPNWIVTATHCVRGKSPSSIVIRLGAHRRTSTVGTEQDIRVSKVVTHPSYHKPSTYSHDIALLKLERPAQLNRNVNLVCLPHAVAAPTNGTRCWITGWGRLASGGATPDKLQQASVPVVSRARCDRAYPGKIHDSMICAGLDQGGIDSCQGDSGGPMVCETGGRYYLQGVTSWGYGCASPGKFGVYAKVKYLLNWLNNEMAKN